MDVQAGQSLRHKSGGGLPASVAFLVVEVLAAAGLLHLTKIGGGLIDVGLSVEEQLVKSGPRVLGSRRVGAHLARQTIIGRAAS